MECMNSNYQQRLIHALRDWIAVPDSIVSDEELLSNTEGSFLRYKIELAIVINDFKYEFFKSIGLGRFYAKRQP